MLQLQRASAGSGKTYLLANKFIEFFISVKDGESRRLRTSRELRDSLGHILAITFTNKATAEMKLRIVEKLDALGAWKEGDPIEKTDYLKDFSRRFDAPPAKIAETCREALRILLNDYGDFKVSTIDSFFQTVLRTFAFEADLDESYQLELDSDYVSQVGLDTTLDDIETGESDPQESAWIHQLIDSNSDEGKGWNIFQKKASDKTIYGQILRASRNLNSEDFKEVREQLDEYFEATPDFFDTYRSLCDLYENPIRETHARMRDAATLIIKGFADAGLDMSQTAGQHLESRAIKMAKLWKWDYDEKKPLDFTIPEFTRKGSKTRVFNPKASNPWLNTETEDQLERLAIAMYKAYSDWRTLVLSADYQLWKIYKATLPHMGLLQSVRKNSKSFLNDSNTVELGETNSILRRIIGEEDAPFVYERIGSRLEHFLIDEFQDTSRLQWSNLRPLLAESEGHGNDNLIIGDAKQSIYRFRNADSSLITDTVPRQFAASCVERGNTPAENTNWRSARRIVAFNNLFFRYLSAALPGEMESLYSNTVQPPHHSDDYGYIRVQLVPSAGRNEMPAHFTEIPSLICDMLDRGYRQSEIAVLVDRREDGQSIISCLMDHNRQPEARHKIEFISAESLTISDSTSVQTVISVLEAIDKGTRAELRDAEQRKKKGIGDWSKLKVSFSFYALSHRDMTLSEQMTSFLESDQNPDVIRDILSGMQTTSLPALIESITEHFIPETMRRSEAAYLAALQDTVGEFCEGSASDVASFLRWWDKKGQYRSVASPEGTEAVEIMTVHKSKGLEFRCVIAAYSKESTSPLSAMEKEWLWVRPEFPRAEGIPTPPWMPVWSTPDLATSPHADLYADYLGKYMKDKVNMAYVAFTRAVDELYIFAPYDKDKEGNPSEGPRIGSFLWQLGLNASEIIPEIRQKYPDVNPYIPDSTEIEIDQDTLAMKYGILPTPVEIASRRKGKESEITNHPIEDYRSAGFLAQLHYVDPADPERKEEDSAASPTEETDEQRQRGELLHRAMEGVETSSDLKVSLQRLRSKGLISRATLLEWEEMLDARIKEVEGYGWFDPGLKILNERGIVMDGRLIRPDRVMLRPDGSGVVVDYKFGDTRKDSSYIRQLRKYVAALKKTGAIKKAEAYIWYVCLGEVVKCDVSDIAAVGRKIQ